DDLVCPSCSAQKDSWTLVAEKTRSFQLSTTKFLVLRAGAAGPLPEGPLDERALGLEPAEVVPAVRREVVQRLVERGGRPSAASAFVVRLVPRAKRPGPKGRNVALTALHASREAAELAVGVEWPDPLAADALLDVKLLAVFGAGDLPERPWPDVTLVDLGEETELGHAPELEVAALGKRPRKLPVAEVGRVHVRVVEEDGAPLAGA